MKDSAFRSPLRKGFTLIELSIVLVVIALIAGGVVVGQELIRASQVRKDIGQIEEIRKSVITFKIKYNSLPGDILNPTHFFGTLPYAAQGYGTGDGLIGPLHANAALPGRGCHGYYTDNRNAGLYGDGAEITQAWDQLARAGYMQLNVNDINNTAVAAVPGKGYPALSTNPSRGITLAACDGANYIVFGVAQQFSNLLYFTAKGSALIAKMLDEKLDDGRPLSGKILNRGFLNNNYLWLEACYTGGQYYSVDTSTYICPLRIEAGY